MRRFLLALALVLGAGVAYAQQQYYQNFNTAQVSCGTTGTLVEPIRAFRNAITMTVPSGGVTVYVGATAAVTSSTGFPIVANGSFTINYGGAVYCIAASTQTLNVAETY